MIMLDPQPFVGVLAALMERDGRSTGRIAWASHVDSTYLIHMIHGRRTPPQRDIVQALAETLCRSDGERRDLLVSAGWPLVPDLIADPVQVEWGIARPVAWCRVCDRRWRAHARNGRAVCSVCVEREYTLRAERIAAFEPESVLIQIEPVADEVLIEIAGAREDRPRTGGWYCRGCRKGFHTAEMIRVHLEGYFCRACHRKKLDRLCGVAPVQDRATNGMGR
jgi:hypothetical protein